MEACIGRLTSHGVIPVLRPLNPVAGICRRRPAIGETAQEALSRYTARPLSVKDWISAGAVTMCTNCTGRDLVPGRDE